MYNFNINLKNDGGYVICTVANENYLEFLYYFVKSILEKCTDMSELVILYTGENFLNDPIYINDKIKVIKYDEVIETKTIWDDGWQKNVNLKTQFLRYLAVQSDHPIFLIDVDSYVLHNFIDVVDFNKDILVTLRPNHYKPYIASFVGLIKPKRCINFIDQWRKNMDRIKQLPKETVALIDTIKYFKEQTSNTIGIQEVLESTISCIESSPPPSDAKILHFKGGSIGDIKKLLSNRLQKLKKII